MITKVLVGVFVIAAIGSNLAFGTTEVIRDPKAWDFAPLLYYDRVLRCTVTTVEQVDVSADALYQSKPPGDSDFSVKRLAVTVRVLEVLRGSSSIESATFLVVDDIYEMGERYVVGAEMIVCLKYHTFLKSYFQTGPYGRYVRTESGWQSESTPRGVRTFSDATVREKIASMDLTHVADEAELIVKGVVRSVTRSAIYGPDSTAADMVTLRLDVQAVQKGVFAGDSIEIIALTAGLYLPAWRKHVPRSFAVGQSWLCFLKKNEIGWYPFAGTNGLLRIDGTDLIYDERVVFWHSKNQVDKAIARAQGGNQ